MENMNFQVSFRPQGEKLISSGAFFLENKTVTLTKKVGGVFSPVMKSYLTFTFQDVAAVRPGEMRGYTSLIFELKSGESIDISLPKKVIGPLTEEINRANA